MAGNDEIIASPTTNMNKLLEHERKYIKTLITHEPEHCRSEHCCIHNPSDHHMRGWKMNFRFDRGIMERICPEHGVGHPDPDDAAYHISIGESHRGVHGCCGCCHPPSLRHNGVGEGDMYTDEQLHAELYPNTTMPIDEDLRRYTAPPDNQPEEPRYSTAGILAYIESWIPGDISESYRIEEVEEILEEALLNLMDKEIGIDTI